MRDKKAVKYTETKRKSLLILKRGGDSGTHYNMDAPGDFVLDEIRQSQGDEYHVVLPI